VTPIETELRELCCYYEWSEPPNLAAAGALQAAADAVKNDTLSPDAAELVVALWQPFAGLEARVGHVPPVFVTADTEEELQRHIIADMRRMFVRETNPAKRAHLVELMEEQIKIFARGMQRAKRIA
jgi:hypothetical protein